MPEFVSTMTSTSFVMRVEMSETSATTVIVTGYGFSYDPETGALLAGEVQDISLSDSALSRGGRWVETHVDRLMGVNLAAESLADMFGNKFWNEAKALIETFDKIAGLHDGISTGYFSKTKNVVQATDQSDNLTGHSFADRIDGMDGDDDIAGGRGHDSLYGGRGDDYLNGGVGNDLLVDREGHNSLSGGKGADILIAGRGVDMLSGGAGDDILMGGGGIDRMSGGAGADRFVFNLKDSGRITISDFGADDRLVNLNTGSAEEAYKSFMEHAHQSGRHVVYDEGEVHLVLRNTKLWTIDINDFADARDLPDLGLL